MGLGPTRERLVDPMPDSSHDPLCPKCDDLIKRQEIVINLEMEPEVSVPLVEVYRKISNRYKFANEPTQGSVCVWRDGQYVWENPQ